MCLKMRSKWLLILVNLSQVIVAITNVEPVTEVVFTVSSSRGTPKTTTDFSPFITVQTVRTLQERYNESKEPKYIESDLRYEEPKDPTFDTSSIGNTNITETFQQKKLPVDSTSEKPQQQLYKKTTPPNKSALPANGKYRKRNRLTKLNDTKEILAVEGSERDSQVVFVSENAGYVPLPPRTRPGTLVSGIPSSPSSNGPKVFAERTGTTGTGLSGPSGIDNDLTASGLDWRHSTTAIHESWDRELRRFRFNNTKVQHIEAECQDDYMKIRIGFNGSFTGLLYSAGYAYDPDCMYINGTGRDYYEFYIQLNRCGTLGKNTHADNSRKNPTKNFMWNTVTVQYNPLIEEEFDEHFKVTCEYGYDFWKTVTFPFLDVEVATGNPVVFTLTPPECYMEIRYGYGTQGNRVTGPVRVGDPLTLIIYMRSKYDGFDIVVNDCYAHNGATKKIQLIDEFGCPVDDKLISRFRGSWSDSGVFETQVFAYMKTFRFTGSPALYIECDVRMCHGRCPSQQCHWRNSKQKRSLNATEEARSNSTGQNTLSENVNLFQSLRVLQEGENDESVQNPIVKEPVQDSANSICMKTGWFGAMVTLVAAVFFALCGILLTTCTRIRKQKREPSSRSETASSFGGYMSHKGCIN